MSVRRPLACPTGAPWDDGVAVVRTLRAQGHEAYLVGGCVRDLMLGRAVKDVDVATSAAPDTVERCFASTVAVGKAFGVIVVVMSSGRQVEVATFRNDGAYIDGRRPSAVTFSCAEDDVARRDFTINALLFDPLAAEIVDHVDGLTDLDRRRLRAVGDAAARLREDRLRVLRGLRFAAQLRLDIEPATWHAICRTDLEGLSGERVAQEWLKGLAGERRGAWLRLLDDAGRLAEFSPPLAALRRELRDATATRLDRLRDGDPREAAAAAWLADCDVLPAGAWLTALPVANILRDAVLWLLREGRGVITLDDPAQRWRTLQRASAPALAALPAVLHSLQTPAGQVVEVAAWCDDARARRGWRGVVRAADLIALGAAPGPALGELLRALEDEQLRGRVDGRATALAWASRRLQR